MATNVDVNFKYFFLLNTGVFKKGMIKKIVKMFHKLRASLP